MSRFLKIERSRLKHEEQTLNEVFNIWLEEHAKPNNKSWDQEQRRYELYIKNHLGNKHLSEITPDVIRRWKLKLSNQKKQRCKKGETLSKGMIHRALLPSSVYVFASTKSKTGYLAEPKRAWKALLKRAGLDETIRLHDLRRTMGSWQAISGSSTKLIGASLAHKSEQTTVHYADLTIDPIRESIEKAVKAMENVKDTPDKVVPIRKTS